MRFSWLRIKLFFGWRPKIKAREIVGSVTFTKEQIMQGRRPEDGSEAFGNMALKLQNEYFKATQALWDDTLKKLVK